MFPCRSRVATLRLGPKFFENAFFEKFSGYPIFRCFWVFWDRCHYRKFFLTRFQFLGPGSRKKNWSQKFCVYPVILTWEEFWDTRHYSDFSQKKRLRKKKISECAFPLFTCRAVILLVSRLASLAQSSLRPAQYRRWAFIQLCISELIIADPFCYHIISLPSSTYIYVVRLTLPGNLSIQALRVLTTRVADHRLLLGKNW